jgi:hypothetical protein
VVVRWFSLDTPVFSTNKSDRHDITEILLRVAVRFLGFEAGGGVSEFQFPLSINLTTITTIDPGKHIASRNLDHGRTKLVEF